MSDPHGHGDAKGGSTSPFWFYTKFVVFPIVFVAGTVYFYFNPSVADYFVYFLNLIQAICLLLIIFMFYKLEEYRNQFAATGASIVKNYEDKLEHHHDHVDDKAYLKERYDLAMQQLNSHADSEWKTGLVELDNFIRMALLDKGYVGNITLELVKDAKEKGLEHIEEAENIAFLRQLLKTKGVQFSYPRKDLEILLHRFDDFKKIILPGGENSHGDSAHHDDHGHH